ncbi:MAG: HEAT repeat domain-containing protein [Chloroflexi bacterium]|nr:HEAT repeat domain-containing protein [Chloroflexota bacterium]
MEPTIPAAVKDAIAHLADSSEPLLNASLSELTSLNQAETELLKATWPDIETQRRRQIVHRLVELAEDNLELNFDSIFKYLLKDPDVEVRSQAIEGLWENEETSLIEPLINLLEKDSSEQVQSASALALGKFVLLAEHNKLRSGYRDRLQKVLLGIIDDKNRPIEVRRRALEATAPLSLLEVKEAITEAYQSLDPRLKVSSIHAMGKSLDSAWLPVLLKELTSPDAEMRYEACGACGEFEEAAAVPALAELVADSDADVRLAAIQALGKIGTTQAQKSA